jgi:hypothetical protein
MFDKKIVLITDVGSEDLFLHQTLRKIVRTERGELTDGSKEKSKESR